MNYKEKCEQYLERAKKEIKECGDNQGRINMIKRIFPELSESEDERIRKGLIKGLSAMRDIHKHQTFSDDAINIDDAIAWLEKQGEQKPAWSEEDSKNLNSVKWIIENSENLNRVFETIDSPEYIKKYFIDWLRSLKDRVQPQPKQEWSEEDEKMIEDIIEAIDTQYTVSNYSEMASWLNSLKPNHWKPSKEQISMLLAVLNDSNNITSESVYIALKSLYNDLKKL